MEAADMKSTEYLLDIQGISKSFPGVCALSKVQLSVRPGTVHALLGENGAGKSTLMKCLFGIYLRDEGEIYLNGRSVSYASTREALNDGISMVHQELNQTMARNVMENIWLGRFPSKGIVIDYKKMYADTTQIFKNLNIHIDPKAKVGDLSVSQRQMIEIAKAVSYDAKIIVFDEPTSSLNEQEVEHLFNIIGALQTQGVSMIYITHKMDEIKRIADDVTIMRDGQWIHTGSAKDISIDEIISLMVGRELSQLYPMKEKKPTENVLLKVKDLSGVYQPTISDVSFELYEGEILGVAGLMGSRRTELVETLFGLRKLQKGSLFLKGEKINNKTPVVAIRNGFALLTEERRQTGIFAELSVTFNAVISHLSAYANKMGILKKKNIAVDAQKSIDLLTVKTPSCKTKISNLSGGNQQKVILGRWMLNDFSVLMLDEPTRGIDIGAKYEIYQLMIKIAEEGKGIIFVSSEMPELLGIADRILVMSNGRLGGILTREEASQEEILKLSTKYL